MKQRGNQFTGALVSGFFGAQLVMTFKGLNKGTNNTTIC